MCLLDLPNECIHYILSFLTNNDFKNTQLASSIFHIENRNDKTRRLNWQNGIKRYLRRIPKNGIIIILGSENTEKTTLVNLICEYLNENKFNIILQNDITNNLIKNNNNKSNDIKDRFNECLNKIYKGTTIILESHITPHIRSSDVLSENFAKLSERFLIIYVVEHRDYIPYDISVNAQICIKTFKFNETYHKQIIYNQNNQDEFCEDFLPGNILYHF